MSQLVFLSVSGGSTTLNGTNTAGTYNLTVPAADGTLLYSDLSGNITFNNVTITGQLTLSGTGALGLPVGNTIQRPTPAAGLIRYNTDGGGLYEGYLPAVSAWYKFSMVPQGQYTISYLVVAGGGSGGDVGGGGGGAGGMLTGTFTALPSTPFTVVIGAGGAGQLGYGTNGSNSYITAIATATGGGSGGSQAGNAGNGGSGGGTNTGFYGYSAGTGIPGQGNNGGGSTPSGSGADSAGGGGGAGGSGNSGAYSTGGSGGAGLVDTLTGTSVYYAGGGGGYGGSSNGTGGVGGGGAAGSTGANGTINTGGGGGGTASGPSVPGGNGGSGVVILSMPTANYSGIVTGLPTVTTSGSNTVVKFTSSGSYTA